jgi:dTDP-4-dehydrorhamnose 3,5-epimerase
MGNLNSISVTSLPRIQNLGGDVLHILKHTDPNFLGFGEAYFSIIQNNAIKAWKMHKEMTLNLVVPIGLVRFVFASTEPNAVEQFRTIQIGENDYSRITVPPNTWFGFQGIGQNPNLVLNIADKIHDTNEIIRAPLEKFNYNWEFVP